MLRRAPLLPDLKELNPNLPSRHVRAIQLPRSADNNRLDVVARHAVGDDDDVQRLDGVALALDAGQVGLEDAVELGAGRGAAAGVDGVEDARDGGGRGDVAEGGRVRGVEEVEVDAVGVVRGADGRDGAQGGGGFAP